MLVLAGVAVTALLNQSVGWTTQSPLVGEWSCKLHTDDADIQTQMEFRSDGALDTTVWLRAREGVHNAAAKLESEDGWRMRGDTLRIKLTLAEEEERRRLARELHDEAGQHLTALGLGLRALSDAAPPNSEIDRRATELRALQAPPTVDSPPLQVLVLNHEGRAFGLVVEQILDIIEDRADVRSAATRPLVLYSVVIGERYLPHPPTAARG